MVWGISYDMIGYAGSVLVMISLMMKSPIKLRIINGVGALFFCIYGVLTGAYPVLVLNAAIVVINLYHLRRLSMESLAEDAAPTAVPSAR